MKLPAILQEAADEVMEMQVAPLIDCVFLLLIYFMVSASLHKTEADLGISLPGSVVQSQSAAMPDEQLIEIDAQARIVLNGKIYDPAGTSELPELTATLIRYRQASEAAKAKCLVTIACADDIPHQRAVDVLNACAAARLKNVSFGMK